MKIPAALLLFVLLLAGCRVELPPIHAGFVAKTWITEDSENKTALSPSQLEALRDWFAAHQNGWSYRIADIAPDTFLLFRHGNGKVTWVYLTPNGVWVRNRVRPLTPDERGTLNAILNPTSPSPHNPTFGTPENSPR